MSDVAEVREEVLLERLAEGDEEAFRQLYRRHQSSLYRYALHMTGRPEAAEEVVQEAFMVLIRDGGKFDHRRGELAAFLFGIARNHVHRLLDIEGRYQGLPEDGLEGLARRGSPAAGLQDTDLADGLFRTEITEQVRRAVLSLPEKYREVVTLCDLEEMEYAQAAAMLHCPVGTVRSRLNRAREMLAEKLRSAFALRPVLPVSARRAFDTR